MSTYNVSNHVDPVPSSFNQQMVERKHRKKRNRATALVVNGGRLLLVRERGAKHWSLPGGGMKKGEDPIEAARRELDEETKLTALSATYLFHYESPSQHHHVCRLDAEGKVVLLREELGDYRWWDGKAQLSIISSSKEIIRRAREEGYLKLGAVVIFNVIPVKPGIQIPPNREPTSGKPNSGFRLPPEWRKQGTKGSFS